MFESLLEEVRSRDTQVTVYSSEPEKDLTSWLRSRDVAVVRRSLPEGEPAPFAVVERAGQFEGALSLVDLEELIAPSIGRPGEREGASDVYRALFDVLDRTALTSLQRRQLLAVSREIEDRAFRVGGGTLRVCFQTVAALRDQVSVYRHLASTNIDVHVYVPSGWDLLEIPEVTYHEFGGELERYWVLAFDGGPDEAHPCGLVARETPDGYVGFWTDDAGMVRRILDGFDPVG